jgi:hypothetical protein
MENGSDHTHGPPGRIRRKVLWLAAWLSALCLTYVLSIGPVMCGLAWSGEKFDGPLSADAFMFYLPLLFVNEVTPLKGPLDPYMKWWDDLGRRLHDESVQRGAKEKAEENAKSSRPPPAS